jgi:hypothetical protein
MAPYSNHPRFRFFLSLVIMVPFMLSLLYFAQTLVALGPSPDLRLEDRIDTFQLNRSWAQYSPYFDAVQYLELPSGCAVSQVCNVRKLLTRKLTSLQVNIVCPMHSVSNNPLQYFPSDSKTWRPISYGWCYHTHRICLEQAPCCRQLCTS